MSGRVTVTYKQRALPVKSEARCQPWCRKRYRGLKRQGTVSGLADAGSAVVGTKRLTGQRRRHNVVTVEKTGECVVAEVVSQGLFKEDLFRLVWYRRPDYGDANTMIYANWISDTIN